MLRVFGSGGPFRLELVETSVHSNLIHSAAGDPSLLGPNPRESHSRSSRHTLSLESRVGAADGIGPPRRVEADAYQPA